jgi:hypothetical protein
MATIDDELSQIEKDIRRLKIEYEQFFGGGRARPPADTQWRLESLIRRYNERTAELTFAQRFRFNNLNQTYAKYVDMWRKKTMQKEGGVSQRHFGAAAKAIEEARTREANLRAASQPPEQERTGDSSGQYATNAGAAREHAAAFALTLSDPDAENSKIVALYEKVMEAHTESGESVAAPNLQAFERFVRKKTQELKDKGGNAVEYSVAIQDGRVKLKARISS